MILNLNILTFHDYASLWAKISASHCDIKCGTDIAAKNIIIIPHSGKIGPAVSNQLKINCPTEDLRIPTLTHKTCGTCITIVFGKILDYENLESSSLEQSIEKNINA